MSLSALSCNNPLSIYDFDKENINETIISIISDLNNDSSYDEIIQKYDQTNKLKISYIKFLMNNHVDNNSLTKFYDNDLVVPSYLNYLLSIYTKSFPETKNHLNKYLSILIKIDKIDIHPMIFQIVFINLIHSTYICELCSNPGNILNQSNIEKIANIQFEVELGMNIFNNIFDSVDNIFKNTEDYFGYNNISSLNYIDYNKELNEIFNPNPNPNSNSNPNPNPNDIILSNKFTKLNYLLTHIDHLTEYNINEIFSEISDDFLNLDSDKIINKFDNDLKMLDTIIDKFVQTYISNYNYVKKFDAFANINIDPISFCKKNSLYFWTNNCSILNGKIFDIIFKSFTNK
jgi:hypothetical protein